MMIFSMVLVTIFLNSLNPCLKTGASNAAIPSPVIKASTSAVITSIIGGIAMTKNGGNGSSVAVAISAKCCESIREGKTATDVA